jgi:putative membrane protein
MEHNEMMIALISDWNAFGGALLATAVFGMVGIGLMLLGFKIFDWMTPKIDLEKELGENKNIAVAIVMASVMVGIAIVVAAAMS